MIAYLRAKRVLRVTATYTCEADPIEVEVDTRPRHPDLSDLDEADLADWARFMEMIESGATKQFLHEPHYSRFLAVSRKVKWVLIEEADGDTAAR